MPLPPPERSPRTSPCAGFALLITVVLVAFLVLILVALASLTRVETTVAQNTRNLDTARQNALFGLQVAIGQLQRYAGPDQRTTARADMDASLINDATRNGRWVGVYGSRAELSYDDDPNTIATKIATAYASASGADSTNQTGSIVRKGSQAILLNWLVSGNETAGGFNPAADVRADGSISLSETPVTATGDYHVPADATLASAVVAPSATDEHALLVGPASVSADSDRVGAPLVTIKIPEGDIPGFDSTSSTPRTVGRYAWWVGDEGAKAHVNLAPDPAVAPLPPTNPDLAFVSAQRSAIELVDGVNPGGYTGAFNSGDLIGSGYAPTDASIGKLLSTEQLSALDVTAWDTARKLRFHDLTAVSNTLLTDTYAGGLKKDLSAILSTNGAAYAGHADDDYLFVSYGGSGNVRSANPNAVYGLPTWGKLRSHAQTTESVNSTDPLTPRLPSDTDVGVYPVMTYADLMFQYILNSSGGISLAVIPRVVLWNPYTRPLKAARYEFGFTNSKGAFQLQRRRAGETTWEIIDGPRQLRWACETAAPLPDEPRFMRFIIETEDLAPGTSQLFGLTGTAQAYHAPYGSKPTNILRKTTYPGHAIVVDTGHLYDHGAEYYRVKADESSTPSNTINFNSHDLQGLVYSFLGQDPDEHNNDSPRPVWPPDGTINNPWYQAEMALGFSGSASSSPAGRSVHPSLPYVQDDPDPYNDSDPGENEGIELFNAIDTANTWGSATHYNFASRIRYLVHTNPRGALLDMVSTRIRLAHHQPGYGSSDRLATLSTDGELSSTLSLTVTGNSPEKNILFEFRPQDLPLMSIGQLQHANLSYGLSGPAYLIGNGHAPWFSLTTVSSSVPYNDIDRPNLVLYNYNPATTTAAHQSGFGYDSAYLVNRTLWDRYFVSTVPQSGTSAAGSTAIPDELPNPRHVWQASASSLTEAEKRDGNTVAAHLLLKGGFNINSTSEQAWRAVLGGMNQLNHHTAGAIVDDAAASAIPRFSDPPDALAINGSHTDWAFTGHRTLNPAQIDALAQAIVSQIRNRGPFVSLGDFINRRLRDNPDTITTGTTGPNLIESIKGPLQEAIDSTPETGVGSVNNRLAVTPFNINGNIDVTPTNTNEDAYAHWGGPWSSSTRRRGPGSLAANAAQFITQADLLSAIGSALSARSDTFVVRTYGDSVNPLTGEITARAWCEAVVQRTIEPISPDPTSIHEPAAGAPDFGRRFKIVSFRWLTSSDI